MPEGRRDHVEEMRYRYTIYVNVVCGGMGLCCCAAVNGVRQKRTSPNADRIHQKRLDCLYI